MNEYTIFNCTSNIFNEKPTAYLYFMNYVIALFGKPPNRFQRFMIKKILGMKIEVQEDE